VRIALLSDIHANFEALEAVLRDVDEVAPDVVAVLGDTINYGPDPRACLELITRRAQVLLAGNHEREAAFPELDDLNADAREMLTWTMAQLDGMPEWEKLRDDVKLRGDAAARHRLDELDLVHAASEKPYEQYLWPGHPNYHLHLNQQLDGYLLEMLNAFPTMHAAVGHTHVPTVLTRYEDRELFPIADDWNRRLTFVGPRTIFYVPQGDVTLSGLQGCKLVINPGSVGQPRDGDRRASWALYDGDSVQFSRVEIGRAHV
jgi:predicted phosphodiesterase